MSDAREWQHKARVSDAQASLYRRRCDHYEWGLRWIRNQQHLPAEEYRLMAARILAQAEDIE